MDHFFKTNKTQIGLVTREKRSERERKLQKLFF